MYEDRKALRPSELAEVLGVSRGTAYSMCAKGQIRTVRVGRAVLVPLAEVARLLADKTEAGGPKQ